MISWLARKRIALGFVAGAIVFWLARPTRATLEAGTAVAMLGELIRIWAAGHLNKSREVTSSGPYRWIGHPLYLGSSIISAGLAIASDSIPVALIIGLYLATTLTAAIRTEEAFLRRKFGAEYEKYREPRGNVPEKGARRFSLAQAIENREHRAVIGLVVAVLLLILKATYNGTFWRQPGG